MLHYNRSLLICSCNKYTQHFCNSEFQPSLTYCKQMAPQAQKTHRLRYILYTFRGIFASFLKETLMLGNIDALRISCFVKRHFFSWKCLHDTYTQKIKLVIKYCIISTDKDLIQFAPASEEVAEQISHIYSKHIYLWDSHVIRSPL